MWTVLITGSRKLESADVMWHYLNLTLNKHPLLTVVQGACPSGADEFAHGWCRLMDESLPNDSPRMVIEACRTPGTPGYPAAWDRHGKIAGPIRNQEMVDLDPRPDVCYAFPTTESRGTYDCMSRAWVKGIPVYVFRDDYSMHKVTEDEGEALARRWIGWGAS